jgi:hypothetical protein
MQTEVAPIHSVIEHILFYSIQTGLLAGLVKLIWGASKLTTTVELLKTNHLPHIDAKIENVSTDVKELRTAFVQHLDSGRD